MIVVKKSKVEGRGVYADKNYEVSELILNIDDSNEIKDEAILTQKQQEYDCDYLSSGKIILMQAPEKYINHSCNPNSYVKTIGKTRKVFAMRDIDKGEEITYDYSINGFNDGTFRCNCGSNNCRKIYQGNFFKLPIVTQLTYLSYLDNWFVMEHKKEIEKLTFEKKCVDKILASKKYRSLYRPTVERVVQDMARRYPEKQVEDAAKRQLHQVWGAYSRQLRYKEDETITSLLSFQSSTKERLSILDKFYTEIFAITGIPKTIVEPACGMNALTYFWMNPSISYTGYDVDTEQIKLINEIFKRSHVEKKAHVELGDIFIQKQLKADVGLLLKALPPFELQQKGCSLDILKKMNCKYLVVSFPTKSISGKEKGMIAHYSQQFSDLVKNEPWQITQIMFETELVYVVKK